MTLRANDHKRPRLSRREWLRLCAAGVAAHSLSGWIGALAQSTAADPGRRRSCILLWMDGGPSQLDTFDLKPGHENGGPYRAIETATPGVRISEHLPRLALRSNDLAIIRSMSTKEGDHGRATYHLRTGYMPQGPIQCPALGSLIAREFERDDADLPGFVTIAPDLTFNHAAYAPGFLGPKYAPLVVGEHSYGRVFDRDSLKVEDLEQPFGLGRSGADDRLSLLESFESDFLARHPGTSALSHRLAYQRAVRMMHSEAAGAFDLEREDPGIRDAYGRNGFGQGCLLARRLIERGVAFVEVTLSGAPGLEVFAGWDTHEKNFETVAALSQVLDAGWSTLLDDLRARGLLDTTVVVWMGEFGRTPKINDQGGRDHYPNAWTTVLAGGGIHGGQAYGRTSDDGTSVKEHPVAVADFLATICLALGVDPRKQNMSDIGRPIRIVDPRAVPIKEVLT